LIRSPIIRSPIVSLSPSFVIRRPARRLTRVVVFVGVVRPGYVSQASNKAVSSSVLPFVVNSSEQVPAKRFSKAAAEVFDRIMQMTNDAGATDEHRALNYLIVRYPAIYAAVADAFSRNLLLTAVDVRPSALNGVRNVVDVIFSFTNRATDVVEKQFLRVDVTEEFPFMVTRIAPYHVR